MGYLMPAQLVALTEGPSILLDKPIMLIGRHPESDIQINSRKISRLHCCIAQVNDYLVVRDLGSTNGIRINGARVVEGKLRGGDELTIGSHRYEVQWDGANAKPPAARAPAREPARPVAPLVAPDDDLLESYDEPVPLADARDNGQSIPLAGGKLPFPPNGIEYQTANVPPPKEPEKQRSLILPDNLELAPRSDVLSPPEPSRPPSHAS